MAQDEISWLLSPFMTKKIAMVPQVAICMTWLIAQVREKGERNNVRENVRNREQEREREADSAGTWIQRAKDRNEKTKEKKRKKSRDRDGTERRREREKETGRPR